MAGWKRVPNSVVTGGSRQREQTRNESVKERDVVPERQTQAESCGKGGKCEHVCSGRTCWAGSAWDKRTEWVAGLGGEPTGQLQVG